MVDKGLWIFVMVLFSVLGLGVLTFAWLQPMALVERMLASFAGIVGPAWVIVHNLSKRSVKVKS